MNVSAIIVTRGDVDLSPILDSLPVEWERLVWDNGEPTGFHYRDGNDWRPDGFPGPVSNLSVYGRYAAIEYASNDLIYVQDDDCIVSDPQAVVNALRVSRHPKDGDVMNPNNVAWATDTVVCNMPANFRHSFYQEHALVGFGACFHQDAPWRAFKQFQEAWKGREEASVQMFQRTCDIVFTALTPRVLVDVPYEDAPWASAPNRMWRQPTHREERQRMLDLVLKVRDG